MLDLELDTKDKIIRAARILFAERGFEGTSVRQIAKDAKVNVALINYYFQNKDGLFFEIIRSSYDNISNGIKNFYEENKPTTEELMLQIFTHFSSNSTEMVSLFKLIISTHHPSEDVLTQQQMDDNQSYGPPSGETIALAITRDIGHPLSEVDLHWAVKTLFSHVCHTAIISSSFCQSSSRQHYMCEDDIRQGISRLVRIVLQDLRSKNN